jgi:ubiquinone/menaquinone biosynthesis C-methylase UbiE
MSAQLKHRIQQEADSYSQSYYLDVLDDPFSLYEYRIVASALHDFAVRYLESGDSVLDIGCGTGVYARVLGQGRACEVFLADLSLKMLLQAQKKLLSNLMQADAEQMPFPNDFFDAIISIAMLEHVVEPDSILDEMLRVIKPGGYVFLAIPNADYYPQIVYGILGKLKRMLWRRGKTATRSERTVYEHFYSPNEVKQLVERNGWRMLQYRTIYFVDPTLGNRLSRVSAKLLDAYLHVLGNLEAVLSKRSAYGYLHAAVIQRPQ